MRLRRRTTWGCALLAVVGSAMLGCDSAPDRGPQRARYLALDPAGAPIGSGELFDALPPAVGLREQIAIKSSLGPPVDSTLAAVIRRAASAVIARHAARDSGQAAALSGYRGVDR